MTHTNNITLQASTTLAAAATTYTSAIRVDRYEELNLFLSVSAQNTYAAGDGLTVSVAIVDPAGNKVDLPGASFTTINDSTSSYGLKEHIAIVAFGSRIMLKYVVTEGSDVSYTFTVTAYGKGSF